MYSRFNYIAPQGKGGGDPICRTIYISRRIVKLRREMYTFLLQQISILSQKELVDGLNFRNQCLDNTEQELEQGNDNVGDDARYLLQASPK